MLFAFIVAIGVILVDQWVKLWTISTLALHESQAGIAGIFDFYYIRNEGASWGILAGQRTLFIVLTFAVVAYLMYVLVKEKQLPFSQKIVYGLLLGGAVGNLIDRLRWGYVVDMFRLTFIEFPIFNVADIALSLGAVALFGLLMFAKEEKA
ncbi:MAG: signal peptidase II [Aerococcaceae bacterium]|nr:signal peptidase II [Aerococcaceae bacterium]